MSEDQHEETLRTLEQSFGNRLKWGQIRGEEPGTEGVLASVLPMDAEEVELLAQLAARHSVPLVALGAGTAPESGVQRLGIAVRFDLMRRTRLPRRRGVLGRDGARVYPAEKSRGSRRSRGCRGCT